MIFTCTAVREALLEHRGEAGAGAPELSAHLERCAECAAFAHRTTSIVALVSTLPRRAVPAELAGLVVAATQAGHRQERAIRALSALSRLPAPSDLESITLGGGRTDERPIVAKAPAVLDRLVDEDLRDPAAAISRRFAGRLDRRAAPNALRERLAGASWASTSRGYRLLVPVAAGVALLVLSSVWIFRDRTQVPAADDDFQVVYETNLDSMDPMARGMLYGLSGGVIDFAASDLQTDGGSR